MIRPTEPLQEVRLGDAEVVASTEISSHQMICCQCWRVIPKGSKYVNVAVKGWSCAATHLECAGYI